MQKKLKSWTPEVGRQLNGKQKKKKKKWLWDLSDHKREQGRKPFGRSGKNSKAQGEGGKTWEAGSNGRDTLAALPEKKGDRRREENRRTREKSRKRGIERPLLVTFPRLVTPRRARRVKRGNRASQSGKRFRVKKKKGVHFIHSGTTQNPGRRRNLRSQKKNFGVGS